MLHLENVCKEYPAADGKDALSILSGISLEVKAGETVAIVGPSGSGKSTLLNIMGSLDRPTSGSVKLKDRELGGLSDKELAGLRNREIGFIFQSHHLLPQCSVLENVLVPCLAEGKAGSEEIGRAETLLAKVGLNDRAAHRPGQLSGGECQRVAVVRALIQKPGLLLADEPTGALDNATAGDLSQLLLDLNRDEGVALVVVTHASNLAEKMGRTYRLHDGRLEQAE